MYKMKVGRAFNSLDLAFYSNHYDESSYGKKGEEREK